MNCGPNLDIAATTAAADEDEDDGNLLHLPKSTRAVSLCGEVVLFRYRV